jgi:hypothetical protein
LGRPEKPNCLICRRFANHSASACGDIRSSTYQHGDLLPDRQTLQRRGSPIALCRRRCSTECPLSAHDRSFHNHAFCELPKWLVPAPRYTAILGRSDFFAALSNSTMGVQLTCAN